ncbi:integrin-binding sialoprotein [Engystomops pustulosus]|uniref:integrin-binding sialoprotein n=1 Tax=Engystomops pustulosus TaxID=76066 RepID=UPI003AFA4972
MKVTLIFIFLWGISSAFYINRFQRKWKGDDSDEKGALRHRFSNNFFRRAYFQAPPKYITYAKASDSSEENEDSDEQEESVDAGKNGNNAASEETGAEESEGNGAEEEAESEGAEEENGGTSAPEVEDSTASQNETTTDDGLQASTAQESSTEAQPTQVATIAETVGIPTELPKNNDYENLGTEEGSNGGAASTAPIYEPENNGYYDENGYYYHENEVDPRGVKGDTYGRYEDDYHYRNHLHQIYAQQYYQHYYQ